MATPQGSQCCCEEPPPDPCTTVPCLEIVVAGIVSNPDCGDCQACEEANDTYTASYVGEIGPAFTWLGSYCGPHVFSNCGYTNIKITTVLSGGSYTITGTLYGVEGEGSGAIIFQGTVDDSETCDLWEDVILNYLSDAPSSNPWYNCDGTSATMSITALEEECPQGECDDDFDFDTARCTLCQTEYPQPAELLVEIPLGFTYPGSTSPLCTCSTGICSAWGGSFILTHTGNCRWQYSFPVVSGCRQNDLEVLLTTVSGVKKWTLRLGAFGSAVSPCTAGYHWAGDAPLSTTECGGTNVDCSFPDGPVSMPFVNISGSNGYPCTYSGAAATVSPIW